MSPVVHSPSVCILSFFCMSLSTWPGPSLCICSTCILSFLYSLALYILLSSAVSPLFATSVCMLLFCPLASLHILHSLCTPSQYTPLLPSPLSDYFPPSAPSSLYTTLSMDTASLFSTPRMESPPGKFLPMQCCSTIAMVTSLHYWARGYAFYACGAQE